MSDETATAAATNASESTTTTTTTTTEAAQITPAPSPAAIRARDYLRANTPEAIPALIDGATLDEVFASVEAAKQAYKDAQPQPPRAPAGGSSAADPAQGRTGTGKIAAALAARSRG